jgi:Sec7-like guanine-nucleotide exchange factor
MRILFFVILIFLGINPQTFGQEHASMDSCFVISFVKKKSEQQPLNTTFNPNGMILLPNGVYDFRINGENAPFCKILTIKKDAFTISYPMYAKNKILVYDTLEIPVAYKNLSLAVSSLHEGARGLDEVMSSSRYKIEILKLPVLGKCFIESPKVCDNRDCLHPLPANNYLTQWEWKTVYVENNVVYLLDVGNLTKPRLRKNQIKIK